MARDWFTVRTARVRDPAFVALPASVRANWFTLLALCAEQETAGLLRKPKGRSRPVWELLRVNRPALRALEGAGLVEFVEDGLRVIGYDVDFEQAFQALRDRNRRAAASRWARHIAGNTSAGAASIPGGTATGNAACTTAGTASGNPEQTTGHQAPPVPPKGVEGPPRSELDDWPNFRLFIAALPVKMQERKQAALRKWIDQDLEQNHEVQAQIHEALKWQSRDQSWTERNLKLRLTPARYLHQKRWTDTPPPSPAVPPAVPSFSAEEQEARFREDWLGDPENAGREWPGYRQALEEVQKRARVAQEGT